MERRTTGWHGPLDRFTPGKTMRVGKDGEIDVPLDPNSPFYFTDRGLQLRTGTGVSVAPGSPPQLVAPVVDLSELEAAVEAGSADVTALTTTVATNTSDITALNSSKAAVTVAGTYVKLGTTFTTSSATAVNVTGLKFTPAANKTYEVRVMLLVRASVAVTGPRTGISVPTGMTDFAWTMRCPTGTAAEAMRNEGSTTPNVVASTGLPITTGSYLAVADAVLITGASPSGDFQIILLSETVLVDVSVMAGSYIHYREVV